MGKLHCDKKTLNDVQQFSRSVLKRIWEHEDVLVGLADESIIAGCLIQDFGGRLDDLMKILPPTEQDDWKQRARELCDRLP